MSIPDSPWQGRTTSSERGSVEWRQPTCTEQTGCAILDEWSANEKLTMYSDEFRFARDTPKIWLPVPF